MTPYRISVATAGPLTASPFSLLPVGGSSLAALRPIYFPPVAPDGRAAIPVPQLPIP